MVPPPAGLAATCTFGEVRACGVRLCFVRVAPTSRCSCGSHFAAFPPRLHRTSRLLLPAASFPDPGALAPLCSKLVSRALPSLSGAFSALLIAALLISGVFSAESCLAVVRLTVLPLGASARLGEVKLVRLQVDRRRGCRQCKFWSESALSRAGLIAL